MYPSETNTIEGSGRKFADGEIIQRTLSCVSMAVEGRSEEGEDVSVHISYKEINEEAGCDLLSQSWGEPRSSSSSESPLPVLHLSQV